MAKKILIRKMYFLTLIVLACGREYRSASSVVQAETETIYSAYSDEENTYDGFHSPNAINRSADIENEYFRSYHQGISRYYGTYWANDARLVATNGGVASVYGKYLKEQVESGIQPDSMHCTLYAVEVLRAGMGEQFAQLDAAHKSIWGSREYAGWSIGYLLVKKYNWEAILVIDPESPEFSQCLRAFEKHSTYPVWHQPDIPLNEMWVIGRDDSMINRRLLEHEFAWGFSHQGYHTWFTRYNELKECNWLGAPGKKWEIYSGNRPLFITTPFNEYHDFLSHVIVFPPRDH